MTIAKAAKLIGRRVSYRVPLRGCHLTIIAEVKDIRAIFGRVEAKIVPLSGSGHAWANCEFLRTV